MLKLIDVVVRKILLEGTSYIIWFLVSLFYSSSSWGTGYLDALISLSRNEH